MSCLTRYPGQATSGLRNVIERLSVPSDSLVLTVARCLRRRQIGAGVGRGRRAGPGGGRRQGRRRPDLTLDGGTPPHPADARRHRWNKKRVAGILGIDTKTLYNKLRRYGVPIGSRGDADGAAASSA
jgi:DNA-binding NtrC family response regulator